MCRIKPIKIILFANCKDLFYAVAKPYLEELIQPKITPSVVLGKSFLIAWIVVFILFFILILLLYLSRFS
jgi:hypothetical protein